MLNPIVKKLSVGIIGAVVVGVIGVTVTKKVRKVKECVIEVDTGEDDNFSMDTESEAIEPFASEDEECENSFDEEMGSIFNYCNYDDGDDTENDSESDEDDVEDEDTSDDKNDMTDE